MAGVWYRALYGTRIVYDLLSALYSAFPALVAIIVQVPVTLSAVRVYPLTLHIDVEEEATFQDVTTMLAGLVTGRLRVAPLARLLVFTTGVGWSVLGFTVMLSVALAGRRSA